MAFPEARPGTYDPDFYWDETNGVWNSTHLTQPGSYTEYVIAIGEKDEIYFRAAT